MREGGCEKEIKPEAQKPRILDALSAQTGVHCGPKNRQIGFDHD